MRKFLLLTLILASGFASPGKIQAQCAFLNNQFPVGTTGTPTTGWTYLATNSYAGEYTAWNVVAGNTYQWSTCAANGGNASYDSELTLYRSTNTNTPLAYDDESCFSGNDALITWTATFTGVVYCQLNEYACLTNSTNSTVVCRISQQGGSGPVNNECANATVVIPSSSCIPVNATLSGATGSTPTTLCAGTNTDDVWFAVISPGTDDIVVQANANGTGLDMVMEVFAGTCGALVSLGCVDDGLDGEPEAIGITGLTQFETIYVRVYDYYSAAASNPGFTFCAYIDAAGVQGDECATAIPLTTTQTCNPVSGNLGNFTTSSSPATSCAGTNASDGWYLITAVTDSLVFSVTPTGNVDFIVEIFSGTGCGDITPLGCADYTLSGESEDIVLSPTSPGDQFWLRISDYFGNNTADLGYTICAYNVYDSGSVTGDECATAIPLTTTLTCNPTTGNLGNFTTSTNPATSCGGSDVADAWYLITATADSLYFTVNPLGTTDLVAEIYDGTNCSDLGLIGCGDFTLSGEAENIILSPTTPGQQFWLRVYDYNGNASANL
ncbi:MAG: hypothetical protein KDC13_06375, partial [Bacteroidetes bacterium]|nr:hypothetical protein [Bacteroidota bacterium]